MSSVDRIGAGLPPGRIERITDKQRQPEPKQHEQRKKDQPPETPSDGNDHIIDELA